MLREGEEVYKDRDFIEKSRTSLAYSLRILSPAPVTSTFFVPLALYRGTEKREAISQKLKSSLHFSYFNGTVFWDFFQ
jgi:hypothetical protein